MVNIKIFRNIPLLMVSLGVTLGAVFLASPVPASAKNAKSKSAASTKPPIGAFDPNSPNVAQGGFIVSNSKRHKYLQTVGVATCVAVSLYDPATKTGVMTHFDAGNDARNEMLMLIKAMKDRGVPANRIDAKIVGGWSGWKESERTVSDLKKALKDGGVRISFQDTNSKSAPPTVGDYKALLSYKPPEDPSEVFKSVQLNLETGEFKYLNQKTIQGLPRLDLSAPTSSRSLAGSTGSRGPKALTAHSESFDVFGSPSSGAGSQIENQKPLARR